MCGSLRNFSNQIQTRCIDERRPNTTRVQSHSDQLRPGVPFDCGDPMLPVKTITDRDPKFLKEAYKFDNLIDLHNDERFIKHGESYIKYDRGWFAVYTHGDSPRLRSRSRDLITAVCKARIK